MLKNGFSEEKFCETAAQRQLPYGPGHYFRPICLMPEIKSNKREIWDTATMEFVIENVLSELYEETDIAVDTVFYQELGIYWIVTQSREKAFPQDGGRDCEILRQFVAWMNEKNLSGAVVRCRTVGICTGDAKAEPESSKNVGGKPFRAERGAVSERISGSADQLRK